MLCNDLGAVATLSVGGQVRLDGDRFAEPHQTIHQVACDGSADTQHATSQNVDRMICHAGFWHDGKCWSASFERRRSSTRAGPRVRPKPWMSRDAASRRRALPAHVCGGEFALSGVVGHSGRPSKRQVGHVVNEVTFGLHAARATCATRGLCSTRSTSPLGACFAQRLHLLSTRRTNKMWEALWKRLGHRRPAPCRRQAHLKVATLLLESGALTKVKDEDVARSRPNSASRVVSPQPKASSWQVACTPPATSSRSVPLPHSHGDQRL